MTQQTCIRCNGTGLFSGRTSYVDQNHRPFCFGCKGTGHATERKARAAKVHVIPTTINLTDRCGGDPTKIDPRNARMLAYLGLTQEQLAHYADLWRQGIREVNRAENTQAWQEILP